MGLIGVSVGLIGFLLHQIIDVIADTKWDKAAEFIKVSIPVQCPQYGLV